MEGVMNFDEYIYKAENRPGHPKLSRVKKIILERLWVGDSVPTRELLELTNQKYFDRRVRELNDNTGCDILITAENNTYTYTLRSHQLSNGNERHYLTASQKKTLFARSLYTCAVCRTRFEEGDKRMQADHRIPLIRLGTHEENNWQLLCRACNVSKRSDCAGCNFECQSCPWAFPEKIGHRLIVNVSIAEAERLSEISAQTGKRPDQIAGDAVSAFLNQS